MNLQAAAQVMDAEAFSLHQQGDVTGALSECLDLLRFGQAISRHGLLVDFLVGTGCEIIAVRRMTNLLAGLNAVDCKRAALALQEHESRRESIDDIARRDNEWSWRTYGMLARIRLMIEARSLRLRKRWSSPMPYTERTSQTHAREVRLLMLRLAGRAFELERGRKPQRASELLPDYLRAIPLDPRSEAPLELP